MNERPIRAMSESAATRASDTSTSPRLWRYAKRIVGLRPPGSTSRRATPQLAAAARSPRARGTIPGTGTGCSSRSRACPTITLLTANRILKFAVARYTDLIVSGNRNLL